MLVEVEAFKVRCSV